jgi:hypothetical protein
MIDHLAGQWPAAGQMEDEGFAELIVGSAVTLDDIPADPTAAGIFRRLRRWNWALSQAWFKPGRSDFANWRFGRVVAPIGEGGRLALFRSIWKKEII